MAADHPVPTRLHGFDALRAFALLLGILLHASLSYAPGSASFWLVPDDSTGIVAGLAFYIPHMFRMILFFILAGFFGAMLFDRLGTRRFLVDRFKRVTGVLLLFWFPALSGIIASLVAGQAFGGLPLDGPAPPPPSFAPDDFPLTHLWFLWQLTLVIGAFCGLRAAIGKVRLLRPISRIGHACAALSAHRFLGLLAAAPLAAALAFDPSWLPWFGIRTPDEQLYPTVATLAAYWFAFAIGWSIQRRPRLLEALSEHAPWHLAIAVTATVSCLAMIGLRPDLIVNNGAGDWALYAALYSVAGWQWSFGLIGASHRWLSNYNAAIGYLSEASYWLYIAHLPVVLFLQALLVNSGLAWPIKLAVVLGITVGALTLIYDVAVRPTWLGSMLSGRRRASLLLNWWKASGPLAISHP